MGEGEGGSGEWEMEIDSERIGNRAMLGGYVGESVVRCKV